MKHLSNVKFRSSAKDEWSCAIAHFSVDGWTAGEIEVWLMNNKKIHSTPITYRKLDGIRITPSVYTSLKDLDKLVEGVKEMAALPTPQKK